MTYKVEFAPAVLKQDVKALPKKLKNTFIKAIKGRIAVRPYDFKHLSGKHYQHFWRLRVGDYRIAYSIDEPGKRVTIWCIDVRGNVYGKLQSRVER
jgi:mRNA-degrading endonuclease RelE of RelBE toxin-antitoxin system